MQLLLLLLHKVLQLLGHRHPAHMGKPWNIAALVGMPSP
jgi:hypothetical protein